MPSIDIPTKRRYHESLEELIAVIDEVLTSLQVKNRKPMIVRLVTSICTRLGGVQLYFPKKDAIKRYVRNCMILRDFTGSNHKALATEYNLSVRQVREIINISRGVHPDQLDLFLDLDLNLKN